MSIFIRKPFEMLRREAAAQGNGSLKRVLGPIGLVALGVGCIVGAGLFSVTGIVAAEYTGPAVTISFAIAAIGCAFAGLCYAEFASMIPIAGSSYTYSYATMGELMAWIIGWDLVLEYTVACTMVSISWSQYFVSFLSSIGIHIPAALTACPWDGGIMNLPAALIVVVLSLLLMRGTRESSMFNNIIVFLKLGVILTFIVLGFFYLRSENYTPYIPENTGVLGEFGWSGIFRGAAVLFFAFLGFDAVSTAAQEAKNPKRDMPIGILVSLLVCTILYILFGYVMTGVANYKDFSGQEGIAPVAVAIAQMGPTDASGVVQPAYPWLNKGVMLAILIGYCSVMIVQLLAQSRIFMTMSNDGLLPPVFCKIHHRFRTPLLNNLIFMIAIALLAMFIPARIAGEMTSIGTLLAFTLVCAGVLIVRKTMPDAPRAFRTPLVPWIPLAGILTCVTLMIFLPADTWIRLVLWMVVGFDVYSLYGIRHSRLVQSPRRKGTMTLYILGICTSALCVITGFWHQQTLGWSEDKTMLIVAVSFGLLHIAFFAYRMWKYYPAR
ncbi:MAG: amino acid permease [Bacteroidaceae bacterium]|nr:amino acid permease [Bacteroidaceae bacterium]